MPEFPPPIRLPGEPPLPAEPYRRPAGDEPPIEGYDRFGVEETAARLTERLAAVEPA